MAVVSVALDSAGLYIKCTCTHTTAHMHDKSMELLHSSEVTAHVSVTGV